MRGTQHKRNGIEIEAYFDKYALKRAMRNKGLDCRMEDYNHTTRTWWKIVPDGSVSDGGELVSPPLKGRDGKKQIKLACEALKEVGARVDSRCGLHVHIDVNGSAFNKEQVINIPKIYERYENFLDKLMPRSRRSVNNAYCRTLKGYTHEANQYVEWRTEQDGNYTVAQIAEGPLGTRYKKVNLFSYVKYGTVEFRHHSGTIEFGKIMNWIRICQAIVKASQDNVVVPDDGENGDFREFQNVIGKYLSDKKVVYKHIVKRYKKFVRDGLNPENEEIESLVA
jgi:hypothetical protein